MRAIIIKSKIVVRKDEIFTIHLGYKHYDLGIQVHSWGVRIMLIWWHICLNKY